MAHDLTPEQQTRIFDSRTEVGIRTTPPGMAFWAGSGPAGKTCRECIHWQADGYYAGGNRAFNQGLKPGICRKARAMTMGKAQPPVRYINSACKYFEPNPNPPTIAKARLPVKRADG